MAVMHWVCVPVVVPMWTRTTLVQHLTGNIPENTGSLLGIIETPDTFSSLLEVFNFAIKYKDLIVNWKRSKRGLSSHSLSIYSLLDLSRNKPSGEIPNSFGELKSLKLLNISYNTLTGKIPSSFGDLESVECLDLSHNRISGSIPPTFSRLKELSTLDLSYNLLEGKIPLGNQMDTMTDPASFVNNSGLCGMQIYVPCSDQKKSSPSAAEFPKEEQEEANGNVYLLEGAGCGYSVGFFLTTVIMYFCDITVRLKVSILQKQRKAQVIWRKRVKKFQSS